MNKISHWVRNESCDISALGSDCSKSKGYTPLFSPTHRHNTKDPAIPTPLLMYSLLWAHTAYAGHIFLSCRIGWKIMNSSYTPLIMVWTCSCSHLKKNACPQDNAFILFPRHSWRNLGCSSFELALFHSSWLSFVDRIKDSSLMMSLMHGWDSPSSYWLP